jgi:serine phosphatase RsbU (regulator of sigma subunit)
VIAAQNEEITSSITYAKRIQEAILPNKTVDFKFKENILIYYKPKDIVSGDFYWYAERDNKFLVAAFDCTGHGVPGAFMSMIGTTLLNKIVLDQGELGPANILSEMDKEVSKSLRQIDSEVNDGMEAGLCCIDFKAKELVYSGAKRPLLLFRKIGNGYELEEYKASKFPIGGFADITDKSFTQHAITLKMGDMLYLFSDGIVDQFDSGNTKRISSKKVKELLRIMASLPINEQAIQLEKYIAEWKGSTKQTDDILVLGIRF